MALAETYRKQGFLEEALTITLQGVKAYPEWASHRTLLGRIYMAQNKQKQAVAHLKKAIELSPDNILAHKLLAEVLLKIKQPLEALSVYKKLLILSPQNEQVKKIIKNIENLSTEDYISHNFSVKPICELSEKGKQGKPQKQKQERFFSKNQTLKRLLSLTDTYIARNEFEKALGTLNEGEKQIGPHPSFIKRLKILKKRQMRAISNSHLLIHTYLSRNTLSRNEKTKYLKTLLIQINRRKKGT